ncbi:glycosyltransferase family 9 protein [Herbaspirillum robiniae]|uniref:Glycosyltransferase family 9 protein n=1 Tax=Herbaspirillum robiniae TaxID=2014887 RepID=A0ABX2LV56_9BURK|nr:glycosyltransferase family 9 protein [Herbaspirillum robiniae]NUU01935.1 glycosyltransferase family 9 protein [Herbaspirillum robiniae]
MQLLPPQRLAAADKILFIAHLAIGDFTYLQNFFKAFAEAHPHLKVHIWIDEVRRTNDQAKWGYLKNYALYDWAENCPFFAKVYRRTYSPQLLAESIAEARAEQYPLVVSLATLRPAQYARLARDAGGPDAWVVGMRGKTRWYAPGDFLAYRKLDASFASFSSFAGYHITDVYADWFSQLSGLQVDGAARYPFVDIPPQWQQAAADQLAQWSVSAQAADGRPGLVFINPFAKTKKRCWPVAKVADLIVALQQKEEWRTTTFVINATPQEIEHAKAQIADRLPSNTHWFSAQQSFFQLPALLQRADLIISVETAVMHLANAVKVPVVALMRRKNPEWAPIDREHSTVIMAARRGDWVDAIDVQQVLEVLP